jgi:hypothetical protein
MDIGDDGIVMGDDNIDMGYFVTLVASRSSKPYITLPVQALRSQQLQLGFQRVNRRRPTLEKHT